MNIIRIFIYIIVIRLGAAVIVSADAIPLAILHLGFVIFTFVFRTPILGKCVAVIGSGGPVINRQYVPVHRAGIVQHEEYIGSHRPADKQRNRVNIEQ